MFNDYKIDNFKSIESPFCNFSDHLSTISNYKNIFRYSLGNFTPFKIKIEFDLYHGCEKLVETRIIEEVYFSNNVLFDKWVNFRDLRYC